MKKIFVLLSLFLICRNGIAQSGKGNNDFILSAPHRTTTIVVSRGEKEIVNIAAKSLAKDIKDITGQQSFFNTDTRNLKGSIIVIGTVTNPLVQRLSKKAGLADIEGKWEHFLIRVLSNEMHPSEKILLIAGSDARGTAYGVFTLSRLIGVSPWKWWADVTPHKKKELTIRDDINIEQGPSVKYRGIFLNDEDWGLRPWASKTFEPKLGNIGPKTYAKIYELLLRLKANTIWPAMHPGTTPFFDVKGNEEMARKYDIVIATAHNEPMMRDNNEEWHSKTMGPFNYVTNRDSVYNYWKRRVKQVAGDDNIYTLGMRGVGDSGMKGVSTLSQEVALLSRIIKDQRGLLKKYVNPDVTKVPQVFIPYKEVLPVYDHGLKVPDDVTLMWPDDNFGYIRRLSDQKERRRSGSSGIYYHISYWGSPHDYLWLSTTQPGLIYEEMKKAWNYGATRMWIVNVGDIKPAEYDIEFFMDMAWNINSIQPNTIIRHMKKWSAGLFGQKNAEAITQVKDDYYRLAFIRRPEFMGWSQVYPQTPIKNTAFRPFFDGDEIARRVNAYKELIQKVEQIKKDIPNDRKNAFFELVAYPVEGSAYMNEKFLYAQKSSLFAKYQLPAANVYASLSRHAFDSIKKLTREYNTLANGKWKYMMDMSPRNLAVFQMPELPGKIKAGQKGILVWPEGQPAPNQNQLSCKLPPYNPYSARHHFIALYNKGSQPVKWQASVDQDWIQINKKSGLLRNEDKLVVTVNWDKLPSSTREGKVIIKTKNKVYNVEISLEPPIKGQVPDNPIVEHDGHVFIQAYDFIQKKDISKNHQWMPIQELGYSDSAYTISPFPNVDIQKLRSAYLEYRFYTYSKGPAEITIFTLPTHPVNNHAGMRIALSVDNGDKHIISYKTEGRSEQWKLNVLSNHARCALKFDFATDGWHTIKVYPHDPGVVVDQLMINFNPGQEIYAVPSKKQ